jgi:type I restriction enzyme S subunit
VPLADLCRVVEGQVDPREPEYRNLPHINGEVNESGTGRLLKFRTAAEDGLISGKYLFQPGMLLYSKLRPYLRKVTIAPTRGVCSADMYPLVFDLKRVDTLFAMYSLLAEPFTTYAVDASRRARMPKLNRDQLLAWDMPLPESLADQRRIAAELNQSLAAVGSARRAAEGRLAAANALPAAYLRDVFEGLDVGHWKIVKVGDIARVSGGVQKSPGRAPT